MAIRAGAGGPASESRDVDGLFELPLAEFIAARNALAAKLKKAGRAAEAEQVKSLPKPSVAAWVVNQVARAHPRELKALLAAGDEFRDAQAKQLAGKAADLRGTLEARRTALADVTKLAVATVEGSAHAPTPDLLRRIATTLEALSAYGSTGGPDPRRLTDDLSPPGFEALASLVPRGGASTAGPSKLLRFQEPPRGKSRTAPAKTLSDEDERRERKAAASKAHEEARRSLGDVRTQAEKAERQLRTAASAAQAAEQAKHDAAAKLEAAAAAASAARQHARAMAAEAEEAAQRVEDAERELERARVALESV